MLFGRLLKLRHPRPRRRLRDALSEREPRHPDAQPFASFFERERERRARARQRRRVAALAVAAHVVVLGAVVLASWWRADQLHAGSVPVRLAGAGEVAMSRPGARTNAARVTGVRLTVTPAGAHALHEAAPPTSGDGGRESAAARAYLTRLQLDLLRPHLRFPRRDDGAPALRTELTLRLAIARGGELVEAGIQAPCSRAELCEALVAAARAAAPFPPHVLGDAEDGVWHVSVPVIFRP